METIKKIIFSKRALVVAVGVAIAVLQYLQSINLGGSEIAIILSFLTAVTKLIDVKNQEDTI